MIFHFRGLGNESYLVTRSIIVLHSTVLSFTRMLHFLIVEAVKQMSGGFSRILKQKS